MQSEINIQNDIMIPKLYQKRNPWSQIERDCNMELFEQIQKAWSLLLVACF